MREELLALLRPLSAEEEGLLRGDDVRREDYAAPGGDFRVESGRLLPPGELIALRPHTRFAAFPRHSHNYVELFYMIAGRTCHLVNDRERLELGPGDLLLMNPWAVHAVERCGREDLAVNIIVQPDFFREMLATLGEDHLLGRFLAASFAKQPGEVNCLVFHTAGDLAVDCVLESMTATLTAGGRPWQ